jgi:hypothetical protein
MIERLPSEWIHRGQRKRASITGTAYRSNETAMRVHITNLSYDGCQLITEELLDIGETIRLTMPRMADTLAQVRWVKGEQAGVRFLQGTTARDDRRARIGV